MADYKLTWSVGGAVDANHVVGFTVQEWDGSDWAAVAELDKDTFEYIVPTPHVQYRVRVNINRTPWDLNSETLYAYTQLIGFEPTSKSRGISSGMTAETYSSNVAFANYNVLLYTLTNIGTVSDDVTVNMVSTKNDQVANYSVSLYTLMFIPSVSDSFNINKVSTRAVVANYDVEDTGGIIIG
jgi:hypothetical protein